MYTAADLNAALAAGRRVQVTTYLRSTLYGSKHVGWFTQGKSGALYVKQGRGRVCLAEGGRMLVGIRVESEATSGR